MPEPAIDKYVRILKSRGVEGGFANRPHGKPRTDATCWAILALEAAGDGTEAIEAARESLVAVQGPDGRVSISAQNPDACWPTPLAALAWHGSSACAEPCARALRFLIETDLTGIPETTDQTIVGHDVTLKGWPWVAQTSSWVEPTAYTLLALRSCGYADCSRTQDALRLLLDRQLPAGGWNCGSKIVFGREQRPMPEATGLTLASLADLVPETSVENSRVYLRSQLPHLDTPMSLAWAVLGLRAWHERLEPAPEQILRALDRAPESGPHDTVSLSLLLLAWHCRTGLVHFFERTDSQDQK
jgi:hypothetical protein